MPGRTSKKQKSVEPEVSYHWKPIEDLPGNWPDLASEDLRVKLSGWINKYELLKDTEKFKDFLSRVYDEWVVETGQIEGVYSVPEGYTLSELEQFLVQDSKNHESNEQEDVWAILLDQRTVLESLLDFVGGARALSLSYLKEMHQALLEHQFTAKGRDAQGKLSRIRLLKGAWKRLPNNPVTPDGTIHQYCPPEHVAQEMEHLLSQYFVHVEKGVPPEIEAAWLHHRFTQIHPFQDGNGRIARALASLILLKAHLFPMTVHRDFRRTYLNSLRSADNGDLTPLVQLVVADQLKKLERVEKIYSEMIQEISLEEMLEAAGKKVHRKEAQHGNLITSTVIGKKLQKVTEEKLADLSQKMKLKFKIICSGPHSESIGYQGKLSQNPDEFQKKIGEKGVLVYPRAYGMVVHVEVKSSRDDFSLQINFCSLDKEFVGRIGVCATCSHTRWEFSHTSGIFSNTQLLSDDIFAFSFHDDFEFIHENFKKWLDKMIKLGLDQWRHSL